MPLSMFLANHGGLNITDSPATIKDGQATGQSYNYDYSVTGTITKTLAPLKVNGSADAQLNTLGLGIHHDSTTNVRNLCRAAGTKFQTVNTSSGVCTNQTDDTVSASTTFFSSGATQPVVFAPFNTNAGGTQLWMAGASITALLGFTGSKVTTNGVTAPAGTITATRGAGSSSPGFSSTGTYYYAVAFRKRSTQALSNAALDVSATVSATTDTVTIDFSGITPKDTTLYDQIYVYRSAVGGTSVFTTGDLISQSSISATNYVDNGSFLATAQNIPRAGYSVLDNSKLPSGAYNCVTTFKRRLITASNSTLYLSDLDKPESWPKVNSITIPSGGPITALGTIGVPSEYTTGADQYLCIWKEDELWVLTGSSSSDWSLLFVDKTGCVGQSLVVPFNGFVGWLTYNGVYLWEGRGKPARVSRPIQAFFMDDGDLDLSKLSVGYGVHYKKGNQVIWRLSHRTKGTNKLYLKLDTRLTNTSMYGMSSQLQNPELDGVFITDYDTNSYYGLASYISSGGSESLYLGDQSGNIYQGFADAATATIFSYETRPLDMGAPQNNKRFKRVLVWVERLTTNDLTLYFWADNKIRDELRSKGRATMAPIRGSIPSVWNVAVWDSNKWDDYFADIAPIEFQLNSNENNVEGYALKLRFDQEEANAPVRIHGFAVEWEDLGAISIPLSQVYG